MLWFLLVGLILFSIFRIYRYYWFQSLQKEIEKFQGTRYQDLSRPDKRRLRALVEAALDSGMTLNEEANKIVGAVYRAVEIEDFYSQGGSGISQFNQKD